jgi:hypothetical protein
MCKSSFSGNILKQLPAKVLRENRPDFLERKHRVMLNVFFLSVLTRRNQTVNMGVRGLTAVLEKCPQAWDTLTIKPPVTCPLAPRCFSRSLSERA